MTDLLELLKTFFKRNFIALWCAQYLGAFNDNLLRFGLITYVTVFLMHTIGPEKANIIISASAGLFMLPFFLFSASAGEIADKVSKSTLIKILKATELLIVLFAIYGFYIKNIYFLLFVLFLTGAQSAFFGPVKYSVLPEILEEKDLIAGNGLIEAGTFASILKGMILGGVFVGTAALGLKYVCAFMFAAAALGLGASLFMTRLEPANTELTVQKNFLRSTWKNIRFIRRSKTLMLCILGISWFWFLGILLISQLPTLTTQFLYGGPKISTFLFVMLSVGLALGSLVCQLLVKGEVTTKFVPLSSILLSVFLIGLAFQSLPTEDLVHSSLTKFLLSGTGLRVSICLLLFAFFGGLYIVPLNAMLQVSTGKKIRSRVIATNNIMNALFMVAASVLCIVLIKIGFQTPGILRIVAVLNLVVAIYICGLLPIHIVRSVMSFILMSMYKIEIKGLENYKKVGRKAVIIANHTSFLDAALIATFITEDLYFAIDTNVAKKLWVRFFLQFVNYFPIDPLNPMAVKSIVDVIKKGSKVVIFPEGRISTTGGLMKIYPGPAMIADHSGADILPICMEGSQYTSFSYFGKRVKTRGPIKIVMNILEPMRLDMDSHLTSRQRRFAATDKVYDLMSYMKYKSSPVNETLFGSLLNAADFAGANTRAVDDPSRAPLSFRKFIAGIFGLGGKIAEITKKGENVGVILPTSKACALTFFALQAHGRVAAMINFTSGIKNVLAACRAAEIRTILTAHEMVEKAELHPLVSALEAADIKVIYLEDVKASITKTEMLGALFKAFFHHKSYSAIGGDDILPTDPAAVLFTSGSEGVPKGVVLSHKNLLANAYQISALGDFTHHDSVFNALPMFHSLGLGAGTILPLVNGMSVFFYPTPLHYRIVPELVYDRNATIIFGTDTFFNGYAKMAHPYDFYSIRYAVAGGEKIKDETFKLWSEKFGVRILEGYGATETSPVISCDTPMHFKRGSAGRPMPGMKVRLESVPGIDEGGELWVHGDNVMLGYLKEDAPGILQPPTDGWYDTGDIVFIDEEGYIFIRGRAKRFAKIGGEMVSLTAVENEINKLWPENNSAVVSIPDPKKGETLLLFTDRADAAVKTIMAHFKEEGVSDLYVPKTIRLLPELPVMGTGKVDYVKLKEMSLEEQK